MIEEDIIGDDTYDSAAGVAIEKEWQEKRRNSLHTNKEGDFLYGLLKYTPQDSFAYGAAVALHQEGNISPGVVSHGFLENVKEFR